MGILFGIIMGIPLKVEAIGLILLGILVFGLTRRLKVHQHLYRNELPIFMLATGAGLLIPGGWSLFFAIMYICWRIFQEAFYSACPVCWQRLGSWIKWLWHNTLGRVA